MKKAIVLGGTNDHIILIKKLQEREYFTILIDYLDNPPAKGYADAFIKENILDKEAILNIAELEKPELVIATCIDQALLTMAYVSEKLSLPCHLSYVDAVNATNKAHMKQIFKSSNIPTSSFQIVNGENDILVPKLQYPLVVKPVDANSSKGIQKTKNFEGTMKAIDNALKFSRCKSVIIEEFKSGIEISADVILNSGEVYVLMISENLKSKLDENKFTITQNIFTIELYEELKDKVQDIARSIAKAFNLNNVPLLLQLIINENEINVIEFSPRIGGGSKYHFIKKITGFDLLDFFINSILNHNTAINFDVVKKYGSMNYIYAKQGVFKSVDFAEELKRYGIIDDYYFYKTLGMKITNSSSSSDRIMGFLVSSDNIKELYSKIDKTNNILKIRNELHQDIMIHDLFMTS